jgi:N-formylglutamate amidohydrolase
VWTIEFETEHLVARHRGTLPVLLTCPHDGREQPPGVPRRTGRGLPSICAFSPDADLDTAAVTNGVAQRILELCGEAPYVVRAEYHRQYVDANRQRECSYEVVEAEPFYDAYHNAIREFVEEIRTENGGLGLLFDLHGTAGVAADPADVYLGTNDGRTVARLLAADPKALERRRGLGELLRASGYVVSPAPGQPETRTQNGGHTVRTYGTAHAGGLDAIQVEIAAPLRRDPAQRAELVERLAHAIVGVAQRWADERTLSAIHSLRILGDGVGYGMDRPRAALGPRG